jgi:hypothetical protein
MNPTEPEKDSRYHNEGHNKNEPPGIVPPLAKILVPLLKTKHDTRKYE